jgi:hypothetical protein
MEQAAKEKFSDSPTKYKATVEELRSRKSAFDASQSEFVSSNADAVGKLVVAGKTLAQIQASPAFNALPGKEQAQIYEHLTIKDEQTKARNNFANYLDYSDPTKLASMTRQQVSALWPTIGMEHTQTLVNKWDQLQNKEYLLTAKMDNEQFNAIAQQFGMDPFDKNKTTQDKADLGLLHDRVNGMLEQAAKAQRRPLTREEKEGIMRDAMARKVTLKGWFASETGTGIFSEEKPIVRLTDEEQKNVFVPLDARKQILSEMQKRYKATAGTKEQAAFEPTEDNIRMWYLTTMRNK